MNVLITRRASLSPWREKGAWWFPLSGCRQSMSRNRTYRNSLQRKRNEDGLFKSSAMMRMMWHKKNFYKIFYRNVAWNTHVNTRLHSHMIFKWTVINRLSSKTGERTTHSLFTKAQSYMDNCWYINATVDSGIEQYLQLKGWKCKIQSGWSEYPSYHTQCIISQTFLKAWSLW